MAVRAGAPRDDEDRHEADHDKPWPDYCREHNADDRDDCGDAKAPGAGLIYPRGYLDLGVLNESLQARHVGRLST